MMHLKGGLKSTLIGFMSSFGSVISYPIPAYQNVPIEPQFYQPSQFVISNVTLGITTTVTTSVNHNYVIGQLTRLLIPQPFGCNQLNGITGYVISIPAPNQIELAIDSSKNVNAFIAATSNQFPQIVAVGDISNGQINSNGLSSQTTYIPGSFINISPQ